ncbi:Nn.00g055640.m01.CDS01 [Neocucurbitaria sp. VM-36]
MFVDQPNTIAVGVVSSSTGAQLGITSTRVLDSPSSITIKTLTSPQTLSSAAVQSKTISTASNVEPTPHDKLSGGAIFAIVVGSIIGIILPIVLLAQYIKRGNRMKGESSVLEEILATGVVSEKAQDTGLKRLQEASARKWMGDHFVAHLEQGDLQGKRVRERAKEEHLFPQSLFEPRPGADRN